VNFGFEFGVQIIGKVVTVLIIELVDFEDGEDTGSREQVSNFLMKQPCFFGVLVNVEINAHLC
jgi:hypothetical protein